MVDDRSAAGRQPAGSASKRSADVHGVSQRQTSGDDRRLLLESLFNQISAVAGVPVPINEQTPETTSGGTVEITGLYIISVAARLTEMHPQTLRKYERVGLIRPSRTGGSLRLYSEEDLIRLRLIRNLTDNFGLNLAGVRLVMELVSHLHHLLDQVESSANFLKTPEGSAVKAELAGLLEALEAS